MTEYITTFSESTNIYPRQGSSSRTLNFALGYYSEYHSRAEPWTPWKWCLFTPWVGCGALILSGEDSSLSGEYDVKTRWSPIMYRLNHACKRVEIAVASSGLGDFSNNRTELSDDWALGISQKYIRYKNQALSEMRYDLMQNSKRDGDAN